MACTVLVAWPSNHRMMKRGRPRTDLLLYYPLSAFTIFLATLVVVASFSSGWSTSFGLLLHGMALLAYLGLVCFVMGLSAAMVLVYSPEKVLGCTKALVVSNSDKAARARHLDGEEDYYQPVAPGDWDDGDTFPAWGWTGGQRLPNIPEDDEDGQEGEEEQARGRRRAHEDVEEESDTETAGDRSSTTTTNPSTTPERASRRQPSSYSTASKGSPQLQTLNSEDESKLLGELAAGPTLAPSATLRQALVAPEFWLLFLCFAVGAGSGITVLDNLSDVIDAHSSASTATSTSRVTMKTNAVALFSAFNTAGRVLFGLLSDRLLRRVFTRSTLLGFDLLLMAVAQLCFAFVSIETLYLSTCLTALAYGGFWMLVPALQADLFGSSHYGAINGFSTLAPTVGAELLYGLLSTKVYMAHADSTGDCYSNTACFRSTFLVCAGLCAAVSAAAFGVSSLRSRRSKVAAEAGLH
eukprot:CAMPEP_0118987856 /NCGR_PEP_ID=MMETSP1173-20130426/45071_1 /TAXON_ID=1034831 /ORGANISM="Rhizochromulina marina cf, Strain CCMP1243" /LENGTH=466 /DNA_ID=CAMNT_0006938747 /DNA_START=48 /DNA_END=1445 /DNA_ORIENTATION=-